MTLRFKLPPGGDVPPVTAARRMGLSLDAFRDALPELVARGFLLSVSFGCAAEPPGSMAVMDHESARSRGHPMLVRRHPTQAKQPSKGADAQGERDSRNNGE